MLRKKRSSSGFKSLMRRVRAMLGMAKINTLRRMRKRVKVKTSLLYFLKGLVGSFRLLHSRPNAQEPTNKKC